MDGFKQCCISDGHLADVLILSTQELVQLAALHKSIQSTGYFGGKAPMSPPSKSSLPPSTSLAAKTTRALFRKSKPLSGRPRRARRGRKKKEKDFQLCNFSHNQATLSVAEACKSINRGKKNKTHRAENPHTQSPIKIHLQLLSNWASVAG